MKAQGFWGGEEAMSCSANNVFHFGSRCSFHSARQKENWENSSEQMCRKLKSPNLNPESSVYTDARVVCVDSECKKTNNVFRSNPPHYYHRAISWLNFIMENPERKRCESRAKFKDSQSLVWLQSWILYSKYRYDVHEGYVNILSQSNHANNIMSSCTSKYFLANLKSIKIANRKRKWNVNGRIEHGREYPCWQDVENRIIPESLSRYLFSVFLYAFFLCRLFHIFTECRQQTLSFVGKNPIREKLR